MSKQDLFKTILVKEFYNLMPSVKGFTENGEAPTLDDLILAYCEVDNDADEADRLAHQYINQWIEDASRTLARAMGEQS